MGEERRRTRKVNWMKIMWAMYCGGHVDLGGEDVCTAPDKPDEIERRPKKETSLAAWLVSVRPPHPPNQPT